MLFQKFFFQLTIVITSIFQTACNAQGDDAKAKDIIDITNSKEPEVNLASHKPLDVEVFRINFMGEGYKVRYYQKENGSNWSKLS